MCPMAVLIRHFIGGISLNRIVITYDPLITRCIFFDGFCIPCTRVDDGDTNPFTGDPLGMQQVSVD